MSENTYFIGQCHQCFNKFACQTYKYDDMRLLKIKTLKESNSIRITNKKCSEFWLCKDVGESGIRAI
jgi:hypothetical protein